LGALKFGQVFLDVFYFLSDLFLEPFWVLFLGVLSLGGFTGLESILFFVKMLLCKINIK